MDHLLQGMFGERSLAKVAGIFGDKPPAEALVGRLLRLPDMRPGQVRLLRLPDMRPGQVRLLGPQDARASRRDLVGRKPEPEQSGIFRALLRSHLPAGLAGAVAGLLLYEWLLRSGQPAVAGNPLPAFMAIVGFTTVFGMLLSGGLASLRPDRVRLISQVRSALRAGHWAVVVHPADSYQAQLATDLLEGSSPGKIVSTL